MSDNINQSDIIKQIAFLYPKGSVFELAAFEVKDVGIANGYFDDPFEATNNALRLDKEYFPKGIHVTVNPVKDEMLKIVKNKIIKCTSRTKTEDIVRYENIFIDIDPVRPSGVSSTNDEHDYAIEKAKLIRNFLYEHGFPMPMLADSGNGAHMIFKFESKNQSSVHTLLKKFLQILFERFSDEQCSVDTSVCDPARLIKLYGTMARKGENTAERPHRRSRIIEYPEYPDAVEMELLEVFIAEHEHLLQEEKEYQRDKDKPSDSTNQININTPRLNVEAYLRDYKVGLVGIKPNGDSMQYVLRQCAFDPSHSPKKASIVQHVDGKLSYQCFHGSCMDKTWKDFRELVSKDDSLDQYMIYPENQVADDKYALLENAKTSEKRNKIYSADQLQDMEFKPINWTVEELIPSGLTLLAGKPKTGKSILALNMALNIANGIPLLNSFNTTQGTVLYIALEDTQRRMQTRISMMIQHNPFPNNLRLSHDWTDMESGGLKALYDEIERDRNIKLVIIDTLAKFRGDSRRKDIYQRDYDTISKLKNIADYFDIGILVVHHLRKQGAEDEFDTISGSTGITGAADTSLILKRTRCQNDAELMITGRDMEERKYSLRLNSGNLTWNLLGDSDIANLSDSEKSIIEFIKTSNNDVRSKDIEDYMDGIGVKRNTTRGIIRRLSKKEIINQDINNNYIIAIKYSSSLPPVQNTTTNTTSLTQQTCSTRATMTTTTTETTNKGDKEDFVASVEGCCLKTQQLLFAEFIGI